jgi:hypothetical protein
MAAFAFNYQRSGRIMLIERRKEINDLCELQNEERRVCIYNRSIDLINVHFAQKGRRVGKQDLRCNEHLNASTSEIELLPSKFKDYNPLLTNADRSWIITHTQSEIFQCKELFYCYSYRSTTRTKKFTRLS